MVHKVWAAVDISVGLETYVSCMYANSRVQALMFMSSGSQWFRA